MAKNTEIDAWAKVRRERALMMSQASRLTQWNGLVRVGWVTAGFYPGGFEWPNVPG